MQYASCQLDVTEVKEETKYFTKFLHLLNSHISLLVILDGISQC